MAAGGDSNDTSRSGGDAIAVEDLLGPSGLNPDDPWWQGPPTTPPVVTGGLGRGFWPKRPLRIPLGFYMKIAPE